jgi:hypothetical protein
MGACAASHSAGRFSATNHLERSTSTMHNTKAIEQHVREVATRNGLSVEKAGKRYTLSEKDCVLFSAPSIDDVDYFLKLHTGQW